MSADAQTGTVQFTGQFSPASLPEGTSFALTGDQISAFTAMLKPTACAAPSDWQNDSDAVFSISVPAGAGVELSGGSFSYSGSATSAFYGAGPASAPYGVRSPSRAPSTRITRLCWRRSRCQTRTIRSSAGALGPKLHRHPDGDNHGAEA